MTKLRAKVIVEGELVVMTGLHVGSTAAGLQIGSVDSPVVRDPVTRRPYIPGSSLKGKLRSLLEAAEGLRANRSGGRDVKRHECDDRPTALGCPVCRLFGSTGRRGEGSEGTNHPARLAVSDLLLTDESFRELELVDTGLMYTEWKFENTLDRVTSAAMPRQIERVPARSVFEFRLVYDDRDDVNEVRTDMRNLARAMHLLEDDALGGHGSRGYGRVQFAQIRCSHRPVERYGSGEEFSFEDFETVADLAREYERA